MDRQTVTARTAYVVTTEPHAAAASTTTDRTLKRVAVVFLVAVCDDAVRSGYMRPHPQLCLSSVMDCHVRDDECN